MRREEEKEFFEGKEAPMQMVGKIKRRLTAAKIP
eukprot:CAMPEP_0202975198 /NCGR_PEP_ID=MMETSP1396-20130829/66964_1 /ASSEMBLY_ACC=CAM_ASM_000872 /TAXON_ID= /ORGANISM="Pseudokeronopsis sp., Strain Brazil" /LENGTH=33 /DNA_ID= /DNA_START= /DNA_END= /DNA_ORIENTATION=